jgi:ABC-type phosphonate transport system ATPase subunit
MCSLNEQLSSEKAEHTRTELERRLSSTDREIDERVYQIYGLSEAERKLVEESGVSLVEQDGTDTLAEAVATV